MFKTKTLVLLSLSLLSLNNQAQSDRIFWSESNLTWNDFLSKSGESAFSFLSDIAFTYKISMQGNGKEVDVTVFCFMNKLESFVGDSIKSDDLLLREQVHFNIFEKYARMYRKELQSQKWDRKTFEKGFDKIYNRIYMEAKNEHRDYVRDIKKDSEKFEEWDAKISKDLKKLKKYSETKFVIRLN